MCRYNEAVGHYRELHGNKCHPNIVRRFLCYTDTLTDRISVYGERLGLLENIIPGSEIGLKCRIIRFK